MKKTKGYVYKEGEEIPFEIECEISGKISATFFKASYPIGVMIGAHYVFYKESIQKIATAFDVISGIALVLLIAYGIAALSMLLLTIFMHLIASMIDKDIETYLISKIYKANTDYKEE